MTGHGPGTEKEPQVGELVDLAAFAVIRWWTGAESNDLEAHDIQPDEGGTLRAACDVERGEWQIGLEWEEPRDVRQVVACWAGEAGAIPTDLQLQYWRHHWPTPAPERRAGARRGWIGRDDPWHGEWTSARGEMALEHGRCTFTFDPIDLPELGGNRASEQLLEAEHYAVRFRRTLKLRLVSREGGIPPLSGLRATSETRWRERRIAVWFGVGTVGRGDWSGHAEAVNGTIRAVEPLAFGAEDRLDAEGHWQCRVQKEAKGACLRVLYGDCGRESPDHTIITMYTGVHSFSYLVSDLDQGPIYIRDYDVYITWADEGMPYDALVSRLEMAPRSVYDRVLEEPEHSLQRAMAEIPALDVTKQESYTGLGRYIPLGVEEGRQEFAIRYNGELFADKRHLKLVGRDACRLLWPGHQIRFRFGTGDPPEFHEGLGDTRQSLLEGWLPVVVTEWLDREFEYAQTAFVSPLHGPIRDPQACRGDEPVAAFLQFRIRNTTHGRKRAHLWLVITPQEALELRGQIVVAVGRLVPSVSVGRQWRVAPYEEHYLRCALQIGDRGQLRALSYVDDIGHAHAVSTAVVYEIDLEGGETHTIAMTVPYEAMAGEAGWRHVSSLDLDVRLADVIAYWQRYVGSGGQIEVPDVVLGDFHKAARVHVGISVDRDPVSGLCVVPAATWSYGACGNEACWQIEMLDQAGHHDRAERYLETFLRTQGTVKPDGRFSSAEGALQAVNLDEGRPVMNTFAYNLDHGFVMECLVKHYRYTGDRAWLDRVAPHLVAACDFVIRERASTQRYGTDGEPVAEWGLLPAGHLEDNPEWRHWFAVNAHAYAGTRAIAQVLTEIGHGDGERLARAADMYRADLRRAVQRATTEAPVVQLRDGTYVPHVPTRTSIRGREGGWFREAAYGALHLLEGHVFDPNESEMTWVLKDLEDNLFVSREWGRPVDLEQYWFSHGGVTIQPNLMDLGIDYLRRGQVKHALRALFNNYGASLYPDVRAFTEHPVIELGHGVGPFYKSSDESKALIWLRAFLLYEEEDVLHLAAGAPQAWFGPGQSFGVTGMASFFGPVTYRVESELGEVVVHVTLADDRRPRKLILHLRCRDVPHTVLVNGQLHTDLLDGEVVQLADPPGTVVVRALYRLSE